MGRKDSNFGEFSCILMLKADIKNVTNFRAIFGLILDTFDCNTVSDQLKLNNAKYLHAQNPTHNTPTTDVPR